MGRDGLRDGGPSWGGCLCSVTGALLGVGSTFGDTGWARAHCRLWYSWQPPRFIAGGVTPSSPPSCPTGPCEPSNLLEKPSEEGSWAGTLPGAAGVWVRVKVLNLGAESCGCPQLGAPPAQAPAQHHIAQGCRDTQRPPFTAAFWDHRRCRKNFLPVSSHPATHPLGHGVAPSPCSGSRHLGQHSVPAAAAGGGFRVGVNSTQESCGVGWGWAQRGLVPGGASQLQGWPRGRQRGAQGRAWMRHEGAG